MADEPENLTLKLLREMQERVSWGVNAVGTGDNILRGVRRPDGQDEGVT
jgi:hypothetical protein